MSLPPIDINAASNNDSLLQRWLGTFWTHIYENTDFSSGLMAGQSLFAAQLYLNFLENINLLGRHNAPVFHRERWHPVTIRKTEQGLGDGSLLRTDMDPSPTIGSQVGDGYTKGTIFTIGGHAEYSDVVSYPFTEEFEDIVGNLSDNIVNPNTILVRNVDFVVYRQTIFFYKNKDPFSTGGFPVRRYVNEDGVEEEEILLWASDALIDKDLIYKHVGHVLSVQTKSSEAAKTILNALWDLYNFGPPITLFKSFIGAVLDEPSILNKEETIESIFDQGDEKFIITDANVYSVPVDSTLRNSVKEGAVLIGGEFLTDRIRLYLTMDPDKQPFIEEFDFQADVPSIFFPATFFKSDLEKGLGASFIDSELTAESMDVNGNPKLKFDLVGLEEDKELFWSDFWTYLEDNEIDARSLFPTYTTTEGDQVYGHLSPLEYFLRYYLRANMFVVVVNGLALNLKNPEFPPILNEFQKLKPAHVLWLIYQKVDLDADTYELDSAGTEIDRRWGLVFNSTAEYGGPGKTSLTYKSRSPIIRWIPTCNKELF